MLLHTRGSSFRTVAGCSLVNSARALKRVSHLFAEEEPFEAPRFGGGDAVAPGVRGARHPAIDESMARPSIDYGGRAHGDGRAEDRLAGSGIPTSTVENGVPGWHAGGCRASSHAAAADAYPGTAAPAASLERRSASPRVVHDARGATPTPSASLGTGAGLSTGFTTGKEKGWSVTVCAEAFQRTERFVAVEEVAP